MCRPCSKDEDCTLVPGETARRQILGLYPKSHVVVEDLDLMDLSNVRAFGDRWSGRRLDVLFNNAGIMAVPYAQTKDGFESQVGTNHLGHFVLTDSLLPSLLASESPRVVTTSSFVHRQGRLTTGSREELNVDAQHYSPWAVYGNSKLANLLFMFELDRRARAAGVPLKSLAAHPGYAATGLQHGPGSGGGLKGKITDFFTDIGNAVMAQSAAAGALPQLFAGTAPSVEGGQYYGPDGFMEQRGAPKIVQPNDRAKDADLARKVWETSVAMTGADYSELA